MFVEYFTIHKKIGDEKVTNIDIFERQCHFAYIHTIGFKIERKFHLFFNRYVKKDNIHFTLITSNNSLEATGYYSTDGFCINYGEDCKLKFSNMFNRRVIVTIKGACYG